MDKRILIFRIGFVILSLGACMGDSESLIIPTALVSLGAFLMWKGARDAE